MIPILKNMEVYQMAIFKKVLAHLYFLFFFGLLFLFLLRIVVFLVIIVGIIAPFLTIVYFYGFFKRGFVSKPKISQKYILVPVSANERLPIKIEDNNIK